MKRSIVERSILSILDTYWFVWNFFLTALASASKAVFKEFLKKHKISNPKKYLKDWKIVFDQGDVPTGLEHDMEARMRMIKTPTDIKVTLIYTKPQCYQPRRLVPSFRFALSLYYCLNPVVQLGFNVDFLRDVA